MPVRSRQTASKPTTPASPRLTAFADMHSGGWTPEFVPDLRALAVKCRELGTAIGEDGAIAALGCYTAGDRDSEPGAFMAVLQQLERIEAARELTVSLNSAHWDDVCRVQEAAFLTGYYAGLAAKGGAR